MTATEPAPLQDLAREQFASRYSEVQKAVLSTDFSDLQAIEELRSLCKTSRYLFEFFSPLANYALAKQYLRIRRLNQRLSVYCDTFYNVAQLEHILGEESGSQSGALRIYRQMMADSAASQMAVVEKLVAEMKAEAAGKGEKGEKKEKKDKKEKKKKK